ncbi:MAG: hypothetical protein ABI452_01025 [Candidatus Limnocylindrales bacterium]
MPSFALNLLLSNNANAYGDDVFPRFVGMTLRFVVSGDSFFLVVVAIIAVGVAMTGYAYLREHG